MMKLLAFIKKDFQINLSYRLYFFLQFGFIFVSLFMFYFIGQTFSGAMSQYLAPYGGDYFSYVLIGVSITSFVSVGLNTLSSVIRESQMKGTLEALLSTPTSIYTILIGSSLWAFITSLISSIGMLTIGLVYLGQIIPLANILLSLIVLVLTFISFLSVGMLSASFIMVFKQGNPINMIFGSSSYFLGGIYFPVDVLPEWVRGLSNFLPITHAAKALRTLLLTDQALSEAVPILINLVIFIIILLPSSLVIFNLAVKKAKRDGTLIQY